MDTTERDSFNIETVDFNKSTNQTHFCLMNQRAAFVILTSKVFRLLQKARFNGKIGNGN